MLRVLREGAVWTRIIVGPGNCGFDKNRPDGAVLQYSVRRAVDVDITILHGCVYLEIDRNCRRPLR